MEDYCKTELTVYKTRTSPHEDIAGLDQKHEESYHFLLTVPEKLRAEVWNWP